ncbi:MAG: cell division protein ZapA [Marinagarivorans sp.]|nr:cell division protein ZapA [Marinagarivorans sp.]
MSKNVSEKMTVTLLNRDFTVACKTEEKAALLKSVSILNKRLRDLRNLGAGNNVNFERLLVVVALNLCNEITPNEHQTQLSLLKDSDTNDPSNATGQLNTSNIDTTTLSRFIQKIDTVLHSTEK